MGEAKFSGWKICRNPFDKGAGACHWIMPAEFDPTDQRCDWPPSICRISCNRPDAQELLPLIAAAPELLAACEAALTESTKGFLDEYGNTSFDLSHHTKNQLRTAIAKATREQAK